MKNAKLSLQGSMNASMIKYVAITAMLIDHLAWKFVPTLSLWGQILHAIGRITFPTMCFFIVEGYYHTHNVKKYALRLFLFAVISYIPFIYFETGKLIPDQKSLLTFNVIFTLFCGLLALMAWDKIENTTLKVLVILGLFLLTTTSDWGLIGPFFILVFAVNRGDFYKQVKWVTILTVLIVASSSIPAAIVGKPFYASFFMFGILLCLPFIKVYNGEKGGGKYGKWVFYIFYPVHLFLIGFLNYYILK